jgi:hypothetical protein
MLSRDQLAVTNYLQATTPLRGIVAEDPQSRSLLAFLDAFLLVTAAFGRCEIQNRSRDRLLAVAGEGKEADRQKERAERLNQQGLRLLGYAREALSGFRDDVAKLPEGGVDSKAFERFRTEAREQVQDLQLKGPDAVKVLAALEEAVGACRSGGARGLEGFIASKIRDLGEVRRRPDRGAEENIPVWKAIAVAVFFGLALWALFKCSFGFFGGCTLAEGAAWFGVAAVAAVIASFC